MSASESHPYQHWIQVLDDPRFRESAGMLRQYAELTSGLESPLPYSIWSFISLYSAMAGSRIWIDQGPIGRLRLNTGIVLIGFPALRKSTAITVMQKFAEGIPLQYGPTDTAGQRQGIMAAMLPRWQSDRKAELEDLEDVTLEALAGLNTDTIVPALQSPRVPPASELYFAAKELGRLLSAQSRELMDFFTDAIDGENIYYQLKTHAVRIRNPLINLLGATTPGSLGQILPRGATEHGFLSRLIFVYADRPNSVNPNPKPWDESQLLLRAKMLAQIDETFDRVEGGLTLSDNARLTYDSIYSYHVRIADVRFNAYNGRRPVHLLKLAGLLCLMRGAHGNQITSSDIRLAHALLLLNEQLMSRAFFGLDLSPTGRALVALTELIEEGGGQTRIESFITHAGHTAQNSGLLHQLLQAFIDQGKIMAHGPTLTLSAGNSEMMKLDLARFKPTSRGLDAA